MYRPITIVTLSMIFFVPSIATADRITICEDGYVFEGKLLDSSREIREVISNIQAMEITLATAGNITKKQIDKIKSLVSESGKKIADDDPEQLQGGCPVIGSDY